MSNMVIISPGVSINPDALDVPDETKVVPDMVAGVQTLPTASDALRSGAISQAGFIRPVFNTALGTFLTQIDLTKWSMSQVRVTAGGSLFYNNHPTLSVVGTASVPALTSSKIGQQPRRLFTSGTTIFSGAGVSTTTPHVWRGNSSGLGGFLAVFQWACNDTNVSNGTFIGFFDKDNATGFAMISNKNKFGFFADNTSGNMFFHCQSIGAITSKIDLGTNFPANDPTVQYAGVIFASPNESKIHFQLENLKTGFVAVGELTTNLPSNTTFFSPVMVRATLNTVAVGFIFNQLTIYTPY